MVLTRECRERLQRYFANLAESGLRIA